MISRQLKPMVTRQDLRTVQWSEPAACIVLHTDVLDGQLSRHIDCQTTSAVSEIFQIQQLYRVVH